ncbi:MAG: hypothetical protein ABUL60_07320 [Myxococcales bacterium]
MSTAQGLDDVRERADFERVISLNEAAKELIARSFRVNLLALDAMVQSKRGGSSLRGFDEVSSQMRRWSRDLHVELERLATLSQRVVVAVSSLSKEAHLLGLLARAAAASPGGAAAEVVERRRQADTEHQSELRRLWRAVDEVLSDLDQLGMMAVVLSRSAMIEASSGSSEQRAQLSDVSQEFYRNSETVVEVLKQLLKVMRRT